MKDNILNLAIRTVHLLKAIHPGDPGFITVISIRQYFQKLGIPAEVISDNSGSSFDQATADLLCNEINSTLSERDKVYLLLLVQDCLLPMHDSPDFINSLNWFYKCLGIEHRLINRFRDFLIQDTMLADNSDFLLLSPRSADNDDRLEGSWIENNAPRTTTVSDAFDPEQLNRHILVMYIEPVRSYLIRCLESTGRLFDEDAEHQCSFRLLSPGKELSIKGVPVITFSGLKNRFIQRDEKGEVTLVVDQISYSEATGLKEVNTFSTVENTGRLIGMVGREGVGKSTLLKLLAGKMKPDTGSILINGYDLWKNKYFLKGIIGFVPEEDLLFEELSVFDNLALTARLFFSSLTKKEISDKVNGLLSRLDLLEIKHKMAGPADSKHIQPGQRRLLNIALELLREPQILLVDNALSGLAMSDASKVIKVLHEYSFQGNLVITSISQADSSTFMLFDKIWILDEGGCAVYNGPLSGAYAYLLKNLKLNTQKIDEVDPTQLIDLVNYRLPDKQGLVWKRVMEPADWHSQYLKEQLLRDQPLSNNVRMPARMVKIPNLEVQLLIFSIRNFKCKFSRINDIIKSLAIGPLIALVLSVLFHYRGEGSYTLLNNLNLPLYQFVSVIAAVFIGLVASVDEIIREKNILEKEEYLEFSRFSYLNSKILYLFPVVAIQVFLFILVGNLILGITELFFVYWIVLFSAACFGILLGLALSAGMQNSNLLHKGIIPVIIAIQLLLGGGIISYDRINLGNTRYTPWIADLMVTRWGYEALAVEQFKNNSYEKLFYEVDQKIDQASFYTFHMIPKLEESLQSCLSTSDADSLNVLTALLRNEMIRLSEVPDVFVFEYLNRLDEISGNNDIARETSDYLTYLSLHFYEQHQQMIRQKGMRNDSLTASLGSKNLSRMKLKHHNLALEDLVTSSHSDQEYDVIGNEIVPLRGAVYKEPASDIGRARLFTPMKLVNGQKTETLWFNISMMWLLISICYVWVLFDFTGLIRRVLHIQKS
ncbi:MAG: ATP-binding cassette domain-containing protein [Bacteroidales bacterium]|nr:ATP-binding cassette domain-containing protein [Bacteroidales bacterium]